MEQEPCKANQAKGAGSNASDLHLKRWIVRARNSVTPAALDIELPLAIDLFVCVDRVERSARRVHERPLGPLGGLEVEYIHGVTHVAVDLGPGACWCPALAPRAQVNPTMHQQPDSALVKEKSTWGTRRTSQAEQAGATAKARGPNHSELERLLTRHPKGWQR